MSIDVSCAHSIRCEATTILWTFSNSITQLAPTSSHSFRSAHDLHKRSKFRENKNAMASQASGDKRVSNCFAEEKTSQKNQIDYLFSTTHLPRDLHRRVAQAAMVTPANESFPKSVRRRCFRSHFRKTTIALVRNMMYGFGDDPQPYAESVELIEDLVVQYITDMVTFLPPASCSPTLVS